MDKEKGEKLIAELLHNPPKFAKQGKANTLLQEYFKGFDIETLRPLLQSADKYVQSAAIFVVSELGKDAAPLIEDVIPLLNSDNTRIKYDALESILVCTLTDNVEKFVHVIGAMEDENEVIRCRAMELIANANYNQMQTAIKVFSRSPDNNSQLNVQGLALLLGNEIATPEKVIQMLKSEHLVARQYGAILAKKMFRRFPDLIKTALEIEDSDIQTFARHAIEDAEI